MTTEEEKNISREEAAAYMISGGRCIHARASVTEEYYYQEGSFMRCPYSGKDAEAVLYLPQGRWKVKRIPIKYTKDMWVDKRLKLENDSSNLANYLFGGGILYSFTKTKVCNMPYKITIEEIVD